MQQSTGYEYDELGRLQKILDAKNQTTEYGYDSQGRISTISYDDGRSVTLSYDTNSNLAGYDDGVTSSSYTYDALGRKLSETVNYGTLTKSFSYSYYANGLKKSFNASDGTVYSYAYGSNNELREVRIPGLGSITISEYQWNRPKTMLYPGGSTREYEYDALMRLKHLTAKDPGGNALLDYAYDYNSTGNIVSKATEHGTYSYGYDGASRLTSADNPALADESYSYDAVGNRTSASNANGSITHNANNELTVYGGVEYVYDANGNMIQKTLGDVAVNYIYNAENRLVKVEDDLTKIVIVEYYYDPFGRRLWKEVAGVRAYFFYSDEGLIAEYDASGTELTSYGYKPDSTWTTDPLFLKQGNEYYFYQNDHLGTPQKLVAQNGVVVWSTQYSAFGKAGVEIETVTNNLRFPGQYFDVETGLHYNRHRYYAPGIGRYERTDPAGIFGDSHSFVYGQNNPLIFKDIYGLSSSCCFESDSSSCCGPDVTEALLLTLDNIRATYDTIFKNPDENDDKWSACTAIYGIKKTPDELVAAPIPYFFNKDLMLKNVIDGDFFFDAWDIKPLYDIGCRKPKLSTEIWPNANIKDGTGEPSCQSTVTFKDKCFNAGYLNYIMWGLINQRCSETFHDHPRKFIWSLSYAIGAASMFKTQAYGNEESLPEVQAIVQAGYLSTGAMTPYTTSHGKCQVTEESGIVPYDKEWGNWNWMPMVQDGNYLGTYKKYW